MVEEGLTYTYMLMVSGGGASVETDPIEVPVASARLYQNHPNPFNPSTTIAFTVPGSSGSVHNISLNVYDVRGALVKNLVNGPVAGGRHEVRWSGSNNRGEQVSSGVYFARFASSGVKAVRKMVLLR
jgi:flagellar hook assembly protein FlgD